MTRDPSMPRTVLVTGATGLVGTALCAVLRARGDRVRSLSRSPRGPEAFGWDPSEGRVDDRAFEGVDAVVHLAGESIFGLRWTASKRRAIRESRVRGTTLVAEAMAMARHRPAVLVSASAIGIYGDRGDAVLDESSAAGEGFLAEVCQAWEAAAEPARAAGIRVVHPRLGIVLSGDGGALAQMRTPFSLGLGGTVGSGRQWMSWIDHDDVARALAHLSDDGSPDGPVNVVAPDAVRNRDFVESLARALHRPAIVPLPSFAVRLLMGEMGDELLLASTRVRPGALAASGFEWLRPKLDESLRRQLA